VTTWVLDLDGVMWRGDTSIPGSADAVAALDAAGHTVAFCTNNSSQRIGFYIEKLIRFGVVETIASRTVSSATAAGTLIEAGERVLLCAGEGAREAVEDAGGELVDDPRAAERVIVGFHRSFDYDAMLGATRAVRRRDAAGHQRRPDLSRRGWAGPRRRGDPRLDRCGDEPGSDGRGQTP